MPWAKEAGCFGRTARSCCVAMIAASTLMMISSGCSSENTVPPPEALVSVETAPVQAQSITDVVSAEGVLFPVHQASISPKITAPVRRFYVQRGDKVHRGELLAVLENKDLAAAVVSAQGGYDQAQATYASTTSSTLPEEIQTANLDVVNTRTSLEAQQKLYDSENKLYQQGAIARKQLDATEVALTAAESAYKTAEKHLQNLQAAGSFTAKESSEGATRNGAWTISGSDRAVGIYGNSQPDRRRGCKSRCLSRRHCAGRDAAADCDGHVEGRSAAAYSATAGAAIAVRTGGNVARSWSRQRCSCEGDRVESSARSE